MTALCLALEWIIMAQFGDEHSYLFVFSLISCLLWFIHFEVVIMMSTDNCCMLCGCRFLHLPWTASDTAPVMQRTYLLLCVSFILEFLLPVQSLHYQVASLPGNPPVHCRRLRRVSCVMRPAVQHCLSQAVGFRCAHCTSEFDTRHAMDCHRRKQSSLGTGSKQQQVRFLYWTCQYFIVSHSGTWRSRCAHDSQ